MTVSELEAAIVPFVAQSVIDAFAALSQEARAQVMASVTERFCELCWRNIDGGKCYCAPGYDA